MTADEPRIRLLICDDHRLLTEALTAILERDPQIEMPTSPFEDPTAAAEACGEIHPDVVLMDLEFRGVMAGIDATRRIKSLSPETRVVIVTSHDEEQLLVSAVEAGASGFLSKANAVERVVDTIKAAARDEMVIDAGQLARALALVAREREERREDLLVVEQLTPREIEILSLLAEGLGSEELAGRLHISLRTVQTHVHNILSKLGVGSRLEAVALGVRTGLITIGSAQAGSVHHRSVV